MTTLLLLIALQAREEGEDYNAKWPSDVPKETPVQYYLPYEEGKQFSIMPSSHNMVQNKHAIDFSMPMRTPVLAMADGLVIKVVESNPDTGGPNNEVYLQHADGILSCYLHLANKGVLPRPGEFVYRGDVIALSGASGTGVPHLHVSLNKMQNLESIPMTFVEKKWVSQNATFAKKHAKAIAELDQLEKTLVWGAKLRLWKRVLEARDKLKKIEPREPRLVRQWKRLAAIDVDAQIEADQKAAESDADLAAVLRMELKGEKPKEVEARRIALGKAFTADTAKAYDDFLKKYPKAPEVDVVRERRQKLKP